MPWSVNKIQRVHLPIGVLILHLDGMTFYRDTALPFKVHIVESLVLHVALGNGACVLEQTVREGTLAVIDMRDDTEIAYVFH